jgi:cysteine desulfurase
MARHYLDHASTSVLRPEVAAVMSASLVDGAGDPSRIHHEGMVARARVEEAREIVAQFLGARSREVVFTSGATEAIAAAVYGVSDRGRTMVVPAIEHSAVREQSARFSDVVRIGVDREGHVDPDEMVAAVHDTTALVHLQMANHEVSTLQPVEEVVDACRSRGALVHVDAAQAAGHLPLDFGALGADLVSVSAHKFGGPPGIGALLIRRGLRIDPLLVGSEQERARRAGMENLPAIEGFAAACAALADGQLATEAEAARRLTQRVLEAAVDLEGVSIYGDPDRRAPHLVCLGIEGIEPQAVLLGLDRAGVAAHSGSACSSESLEPSPVLEAMGVDAHRSLRISVGWNTTDTDIDVLLDALPAVLGDLRSLRTADGVDSRR